MSIPPPPGYAILSATFQQVGTPHLMVTTMGVANPANLTAAAVNTAWRNGFSGTSTRPFWPANLLNTFSIVESYALLNSTGGVPTSNSNTTPIIGTRVAIGMPPNTSVVVSKTVVPVGRQYRGRMLLPPTYAASSTIDANGIIGATPLGNLQTWVTAMYNSLVGANLAPVLLHQPPQGGGVTPTPTAISGLVVRSRIGTIRHRIRR